MGNVESIVRGRTEAADLATIELADLSKLGKGRTDLDHQSEIGGCPHKRDNGDISDTTEALSGQGSDVPCNWLVQASDRQQCKVHHYLTLTVVQKTGLLIKFSKSHLIPTQTINMAQQMGLTDNDSPSDSRQLSTGPG